MRPKVFGVGFHKTGTTSLRLALERLGYRVTGPDFLNHDQLATDVRRLAIERATDFDGFQDNPWPLLFSELDEAFPGSKFILTTRDPERWVASLVRHFGSEDTLMRRWIYGEPFGHPVGNEALYIQRMDQHNAAVREYFAARPDDLLEMDITAGDGWERLLPFLNLEPIDEPFPRENVATPLLRARRVLGRAARRLGLR